ncbi:hypothetical protein [Sedimentitalea arenosa]|uniref:Uncharacterized protein n=1 Tax=Sedimentitalea arenosa TaxID=2798803 RepID=A0A8J7JBJ2_9RHOB|nr:hypothetical protein [Arenibacterium arenosum]MBJ6372833.1 hypothetical protein [Arenibacterium arenosum]
MTDIPAAAAGDSAAPPSADGKRLDCWQVTRIVPFASVSALTTRPVPHASLILASFAAVFATCARTSLAGIASSEAAIKSVMNLPMARFSNPVKL